MQKHLTHSPTPRLIKSTSSLGRCFPCGSLAVPHRPLCTLARASGVAAMRDPGRSAPKPRGAYSRTSLCPAIRARGGITLRCWRLGRAGSTCLAAPRTLVGASPASSRLPSPTQRVRRVQGPRRSCPSPFRGGLGLGFICLLLGFEFVFQKNHPFRSSKEQEF